MIYWKTKIEELSKLSKDKLMWGIKQLNKRLSEYECSDDNPEGAQARVGRTTNKFR